LKISLIIPVLNEGERLLRQLQSLQDYRKRGHEIIVVDGGSSDGSLDSVAALVDISCRTEPGRGGQMNCGARLASGQVVLFLHADTLLPAAADSLIESGLAETGADWGRFDVQFSNGAMVFRLIAAMMNLRSAITKVCTGDQALFIRRQLFAQIKGFAELPLMEDVEITKRLRRKFLPLRIKVPVITSSRRWEQQGVFKTITLMWLLRLRYFLGADPHKLAHIYYPVRIHGDQGNKQ